MEERKPGSMLSGGRGRAAVAAAVAAVLAVALIVAFTRGGATADDSDRPGSGSDQPSDEARAGNNESTARDDGLPLVTSDDPPESIGTIEEALTGEYVYDVRTEVDGETTESQRVVTVTVADRGEGEVRQEVTHLMGWRDEQVWGDDGLAVQASHFGQERCEWDAPWVRYPLPLEARTAWDTTASCEMPEAEGSPRVEVTESAEVVELGTTSVAGQRVAVVVVERQLVLVMSRAVRDGGTLEFRVEDTVTEQFSPAHGLVVRSRAVTLRTGTQGMVEGVETRTLTSLEPR